MEERGRKLDGQNEKSGCDIGLMIASVGSRRALE
jgi:hypothetical protein